MKKFWMFNLKMTPVYWFSKGKYGRGLLLMAINFIIGAGIAYASLTSKNNIKKPLYTNKAFDDIVKHYESKENNNA